MIVGADDRDIRRFHWPLEDELLARLLEVLLEKNAVVVGVDLFRDFPVGLGEEHLDEVILGGDRVIWVSKFGVDTEIRVPPPEVLAETNRFGFADLIIDRGGTVRRSLLFMDDGERAWMSFPLQVSLRYLGDDNILPTPDPAQPEHLRLAAATFPPFEANDGGYVDADARGYQTLLDFRAGPHPFPRYSIRDVFAGALEEEDVNGKIVLIGVTADTVKDHIFTPWDRWDDARAASFGVVVQGMIADQIIRLALGESDPLSFLTEYQEGGLIWVWALIGALCGIGFRRPWVLALALLGCLVALLLSGYSVFLLNIWLPVVPLAIAAPFAMAATVAYVANREHAIRGAFANYMSPSLVDTLTANPEQLRLGGERCEITSVFTDIAGFTTLSEHTAPDVLVQILNRYIDGMCRIALKHEATIDKIVGDGTVEFFGAPVRQPDHAARALACVRDFDSFAQQFMAEERARGIAFGITRIGIHSGEATVGNFGGDTYFDYTAHGDTVNAAARMESANKVFGTRICVSAATMAQVPGVAVRPIGTVVLRGKSEGVEASELLFDDAAKTASVAAYRRAFELLRQGDPQARTAFEALHGQYPDDPLIAFHTKRLAEGEISAVIHTS